MAALIANFSFFLTAETYVKPLMPWCLLAGQHGLALLQGFGADPDVVLDALAHVPDLSDMIFVIGDDVCNLRLQSLDFLQQ